MNFITYFVDEIFFEWNPTQCNCDDNMAPREIFEAYASRKNGFDVFVCIRIEVVMKAFLTI